MAGYPDKAKRARVRQMLRTKAGQEASDREVAKQCQVSKVLVTTVRREMIASGQHPRGVRTVLHARHGQSPGEVEYKPGSVARGGYVYDEYGKVIPEVEWLERQKKRTGVRRR